MSGLPDILHDNFDGSEISIDYEWKPGKYNKFRHAMVRIADGYEAIPMSARGLRKIAHAALEAAEELDRLDGAHR